MIKIIIIIMKELMRMIYFSRLSVVIVIVALSISSEHVCLVCANVSGEWEGLELRSPSYQA